MIQAFSNNLCVLLFVHASALELWIFLTTTPLRIAWNSPNWKSLANMRVLEGVTHPLDLQRVAKFSFAKRTVSLHEASPFGQLWAAFVLRLVLNQSGFAGISNWVLTLIIMQLMLKLSLIWLQTHFDSVSISKPPLRHDVSTAVPRFQNATFRRCFFLWIILTKLQWIRVSPPVTRIFTFTWRKRIHGL